MEPEEQIEHLIERSQVEVSKTVDQRILAEALAELDLLKPHRPNVIRVILLSKVARLAAAAVILIAVGLVFQQLHEPVKPESHQEAARSPVRLISQLSLTLAYDEGGLEAVDQQYERASDQFIGNPLSFAAHISPVSVSVRVPLPWSVKRSDAMPGMIEITIRTNK